MSVVKKIWDMDPRIIWVLLFLCLGVPIAKPLMLPMAPVHWTSLKLYNHIEQLPEGSVVILSMNVILRQTPEIGPPFIAVVEHLLRRDIKLIWVPAAVEGVPWMSTVQSELHAEERKVYGVDYVNLPFVAGGETTMLAFLSDAHKTYPTDIYGTPINEIPLMQNVKTGEDFDYVIGLLSDDIAYYVRPYVVTGHRELCCINSAGLYPTMVPYLDSGLLHTCLRGLQGGAEYERLINRPSAATASMDAMTLGHAVVFVLVILGNIFYLIEKTSKEER